MAEYTMLKRELEELYATRESVLPNEQRAFDMPLEKRKGLETWQIKGWLNRWRDVLKQSKKDAEAKAKDKTKCIYEYMNAPTGGKYERQEKIEE